MEKVNKLEKIELKKNPLVTALINDSTLKTDNKIVFFGQADKLSSFIMELTYYIKKEKSDTNLIDSLHTVVKELSKIMGIVAGSKALFDDNNVITVINLMNYYKTSPNKITNFVLPGNTLLSAKTHIVRTITRECELCYAKLYKELKENNTIENNDLRFDYIFEYLNKLSLFFYELALSFEE